MLRGLCELGAVFWHLQHCQSQTWNNSTTLKTSGSRNHATGFKNHNSLIGAFYLSPAAGALRKMLILESLAILSPRLAMSHLIEPGVQPQHHSWGLTLLRAFRKFFLAEHFPVLSYFHLLLMFLPKLNAKQLRTKLIFSHFPPFF